VAYCDQLDYMAAIEAPTTNPNPPSGSQITHLMTLVVDYSGSPRIIP